MIINIGRFKSVNMPTNCLEDKTEYCHFLVQTYQTPEKNTLIKLLPRKHFKRPQRVTLLIAENTIMAIYNSLGIRLINMFITIDMHVYIVVFFVSGKTKAAHLFVLMYTKLQNS